MSVSLSQATVSGHWSSPWRTLPTVPVSPSSSTDCPVPAEREVGASSCRGALSGRHWERKTPSHCQGISEWDHLLRSGCCQRRWLSASVSEFMHLPPGACWDGGGRRRSKSSKSRVNPSLQGLHSEGVFESGHRVRPLVFSVADAANSADLECQCLRVRPLTARRQLR